MYIFIDKDIPPSFKWKIKKWEDSKVNFYINISYNKIFEALSQNQGNDYGGEGIDLTIWQIYIKNVIDRPVYFPLYGNSLEHQG